MNSFRIAIEEANRIVIGFHPDADGIASMAMVTHSTKRKNFLLVAVDTPNRDFRPKDLKRINKFKPDLILNLDYHSSNLDQHLKLVKLAKIITVDHHLFIDGREKWPDEIFINPELEGKKSMKYSCSKIVDDLLRVTQVNWLALIGVLGDNVFNNWPEYHHFSIEDRKKADELSDAISYLAMAKEDNDIINELIALVLQARSINDLYNNLLGGGSLTKSYEKIKKEIKLNITQIDKLLSKNEVVFVEVKSPSKTAVIKMLSKTIGSILDDRKIVICYQIFKERIEIRAMSEGPINCASLFEGFGGGHEKRAGGAVKKKDFNKAIGVISKRLKVGEVVFG
ncbi:MAG: hypothetical protein UT66_C0035G0004 [candidate division CPR2 bacterium GW2011_GWC1_39_9]|uniref:DDH domain-containing protein n=1 Tax=candidate division CPR2 bacterium GW2011_GWC2_39_10 TaxID=1618345 RepID=A0A0G0PWK9_UNCC2|nr:MAG: hypothetical protein UT18_C0016G0022 [candidate division CPR2 bacterium GW2011_GWC2_39_10]KKR33671.1 MAG: hypothetical protein UT66_C0035G0004 [candidate division CPR2 bacterium GW2011_GWC1_39_9]